VASGAAPERSLASLRQAYLLLFLAGAAGFSFEVVVFRHFSLSNTADHTVFGTALGIYLGCWSAGTLLASWRSVSLKTVALFFAASLLLSAVMLFVPGVVRHVLFRHSDQVSYPAVLVFFLPALCSGWFFARVHQDAGRLNVRRLARLYCANLGGSFVGGVLTKYLFATLLSFTYALLLWSLVLGLAFWLLGRPPRWSRAVLAGSYALVVAACFLPGWPHLRYYRSFLPPQERVREVKEDWATAAWITDNHFYVGNRMQLMNYADPYYGFRLFQIAMPMRLAHHTNLFIAGTGLGAANGALGHFLTESRVVNVDYSPAVRYFVARYRDANFDLVRQPNSSFHTTDARLQLSLERTPFDVIMEIAEHEGVPGISTIKSIEFLRLVKQKLTPDGVFIGLGSSMEYVATVQQVFKNVYHARGSGPFLLATDADLDSLLLNHSALKQFAAKDKRLEQRLGDKPNTVNLVKFRPVRARLIRDSDPCADYGWSVLTRYDADRLAIGPVLKLEPLAPDR
jgi:hypothetical protein